MYKLLDLPYFYSDLEPYIDTHTLGLHKNKHQKNYLDKLNALLIKNKFNFKFSLNELSQHINEFNKEDRENILFNLGGVINHNIYFNSISNKHIEPNVFLSYMINNSFGSYEMFKKIFKETALSLKGSGYTYLILKKDKLEIINFYNQENPYSYNLIPLICIDMWEHAYYLNYKNDKGSYIDNFFEIIDFNEANKFFTY